MVKRKLPSNEELFFYTPMQEVTPKVVAMAVSTVMTTCRIFCQSSFVFIFTASVFLFSLFLVGLGRLHGMG